MTRAAHSAPPQPATRCAPYTVGEVAQGTPCCVPRPHIEIRALSVAYGDRPVLADVGLDIPRGCITALIGPSGCGKTSFLSALNRLTDLIPGCRVRGDVRLDGVSVFAPAVDPLELRRRVGMIFQRPNPFPLSIRRNLDMPLKEHGVRRRDEREDRIETALRGVGLWEEVRDRLDAPALALSGGQQQRLCIARALVLEPDVLLMDEPCSALDPLASAVVEELIRGLAGRHTIAIVTHNLAQARRIANYAAFFWMTERVGKLIEFGQSRKLFDSPTHQLTAAYVSGMSG
jgi:phosphate transport system ATP-binding protein